MQCIVLLGGNVGNVDYAMMEALHNYATWGMMGEVLSTSHVVESEPWGYESQNRFHNIVAVLTYRWADVHQLLHFFQNEEKKAGRREKADPDKYEDRPLDIDILFCDNQIIDTPDLQVPHPRLHLRRFTLMPLAEVAPDFVHPVIGKTMRQLLDECADNSVVKTLDYKIYPR